MNKEISYNNRFNRTTLWHGYVLSLRSAQTAPCKGCRLNVCWMDAFVQGGKMANENVGIRTRNSLGICMSLADILDF